MGIPKLPNESETRHAGSGREEYRILTNNTPNRHQNGITHIHRELVDMLTEKEVRVAKLAFSHMDVNKDGKVTELEAKKAFSDYFGQVNMNDRRRCSVIESYARHATARAMALDIKDTGAVTWPEFLNGQAKFIIGVRPNPTQ